MGQQIGRTGQVYAKDAATYGVAPTFGATDAVKHLDFTPGKSLNRQNSLERKGTPGLSDRFSRHVDAKYALSAYLSPSGTLGVAPNGKVFYKHAFGAESVGSLSTTIASSPTTTGATLTSVSGLSVGKFALIDVTGVGPCGVIVKSISGSAVTWSPELPDAPTAGDTFKQGVTYTPSSLLPAPGFNVGRYLADHNWELSGAIVEKLGLSFDGNDECKFTASGPARDLVKPAQSKPGSFTAVGGPVTGIAGYLYLDATALKATKFNFELNNMSKLINDSFGTQYAEDHFRNGRRDVTFTLEQRLLSSAALYELAEDATDASLFVQAGTVEGRIICVYAPRIEFDIPDVQDPDGEIIPSYRGVCKETLAGLDGASVGGNDEIFLGLL